MADDIEVSDSADGLSAEEAAIFNAMKSGEPTAVRTADDFTDDEDEFQQPKDASSEDEEDLEEEDEDEVEEAPRSRDPISGLKARLAKEKTARVQLQQQMAIGQQRLEQLMRLVQPQQPEPEPEPEPDPDDDIFGTVRHLQNQLKQSREQDQQRQAIEGERRQAMEMASWAQRHEEAFAKQTPDYLEAVQYYDRSRAAELRHLGMPDAQIQQVIAQDKMNLVRLVAQQARQGRNVSPAAAFYAVAKERGYRGKAQDDGLRIDQERTQEVRQKRARSNSLSRAGGSARTQEISFAEMANMNEESFARIYGKLGGTAKNPSLRKLLGG